MKLLILIHSLSSGGAERATANLANHWAGRGWDLTIVTIAPRSLDVYDLDASIERIALSLADESPNALTATRNNLRRVAAVRRVLRQTKPDIALGMMTGANVFLALASSGMLGLRAIGSERIHPPQLPLGRAWEALRRITYGRLAAVTALTSESARWLEGHTSARRVGVIPNATIWPLPTLEPRIPPESITLPARRVLLGVGRAAPQKQFETLVEAFRPLAAKHAEWDLVILGDGPLHPALESQVQSLGLASRVFLPGRAGNIGEWYERADLFAMSSLFEGFPNSLAEAMAYGLPAVSFDCDTGPRDIIRHEVDGLLVAPGDVAGFRDALDRLMGDSGLRLRFAERAVEMRERFSMERIVGMWERLFQQVLASRGKTSRRAAHDQKRTIP